MQKQKIGQLFQITFFLMPTRMEIVCCKEIVQVENENPCIIVLTAGTLKSLVSLKG